MSRTTKKSNILKGGAEEQQAGGPELPGGTRPTSCPIQLSKSLVQINYF